MRQYFYLVVCNYDESSYPEKIFLQEHDAIQWGRRQAAKTLLETGDSNYEYMLYKQEITRTGVIDLKNGKRLEPYPIKGLVDSKLITPPCFDDDCFGADYDIDKGRL